MIEKCRVCDYLLDITYHIFMNTSPHDFYDESLVSWFKDVMPSVCFTINEQINDCVGLVVWCPSFYSFEINNIDIIQHILLFSNKLFVFFEIGDPETDSDLSVDSNDIGNDLRYNNYNFDNNEYLQRLGIDNNVNEKMTLMSTRTMTYYKKENVLTFAICYLIRICIYFVYLVKTFLCEFLVQRYI